eukprot:400786_1
MTANKLDYRRMIIQAIVTVKGVNASSLSKTEISQYIQSNFDINNDSVSITTLSKKLAEGINECWLKKGKVSNSYQLSERDNYNLRYHEDYNKGDIYLLSVENNKGLIMKYVGQANCFTTCGKHPTTNNPHIKRRGYKQRWKEHVKYAHDKSSYEYNNLLGRHIRKYGEENFTQQLIGKFPKSELNDRETYYIKLYDTFKSKHGLNLTSGGDKCEVSEETKEKIRKSNMGKNKGKVYPKMKRKNAEDNNLPKYISKIHQKINNKNNTSRIKEGYRVNHCPWRKNKRFLGGKYTMEQKLEFAKQYIKTGEYPKDKTRLVLNRTNGGRKKKSKK